MQVREPRASWHRGRPGSAGEQRKEGHSGSCCGSEAHPPSHFLPTRSAALTTRLTPPSPLRLLHLPWGLNSPITGGDLLPLPPASPEPGAE